MTLSLVALRIAIDVAREALEQASIRVGEINSQIPRTFGDTYVPVSEFDCSMPHAKMQEYVNVDWNQIMSIVGLVGEEGQGRIITEARYIKIPGSPFAEVVFIVDEKYQQFGIASFLYKMLIRLAKEKRIKGFIAEVLFSNIGMMKVFRKGDLAVKARLESGVYHIEIPFSKNGGI